MAHAQHSHRHAAVHAARANAHAEHVDIRMRLTRNSADYFGTYGELTFTATDPQINRQCGTLMLKTIELPIGKYDMSHGKGDLPYPLQTTHAVVDDPLRRPKDTCPRILGGRWGFTPPMPPGTTPEDYNAAMDSSLYTFPANVYTHSGLWSGYSLFCILVGSTYCETQQQAIFPYPDILLNRIYMVKGFTPEDTLTQQLKMNLWVYRVEKQLKRKPKMMFDRVGEPQKTGPVPKPVNDPRTTAPAPRPSGNSRASLPAAVRSR